MALWWSFSTNKPNKNKFVKTYLLIKTSFDGNLLLFSEWLLLFIAASTGMLGQPVSHSVWAPLLGKFLIFLLFFNESLAPLLSMETEIPYDQLTSGMTEEEWKTGVK